MIRSFLTLAQVAAIVPAALACLSLFFMVRAYESTIGKRHPKESTQ